MRTAFVYARTRESLRVTITRGEAPDTGLMGQNHLAPFGIDAEIRESSLRRRHRGGGAPPPIDVDRPRADDPGGASAGTTHLHVDRAYDFARVTDPALPPGHALQHGPLSEPQAEQRPEAEHLLASGIRAAGAVICFAAAQRESLIELLGADPARVHTVGLGVGLQYVGFWLALHGVVRRCRRLGGDSGHDVVGAHSPG